MAVKLWQLSQGVLVKASYSTITLAELGWFPITLNIWTQMIKYLMRFFNGTNNSILDEAFHSAKLNETRWYQSIHNFLRVNGFAYVLDDSLTFDDEVFPRAFKQIAYRHLLPKYY